MKKVISLMIMMCFVTIGFTQTTDCSNYVHFNNVVGMIGQNEDLILVNSKGEKCLQIGWNRFSSDQSIGIMFKNISSENMCVDTTSVITILFFGDPSTITFKHQGKPNCDGIFSLKNNEANSEIIDELSRYLIRNIKINGKNFIIDSTLGVEKSVEFRATTTCMMDYKF